MKNIIGDISWEEVEVPKIEKKKYVKPLKLIKRELHLQNINKPRFTKLTYCEICFEFKDKLVRDHNHLSGFIRGTLCSDCNLYLGFYENNNLNKNTIYKWCVKYLIVIQSYLKRGDTIHYYRSSSKSY